jgi:mitogen-activated protein kinase kinase kinase
MTMHMSRTLDEIGRGREARVLRYRDHALRIPHDAAKTYDAGILDLKKHPNVVHVVAIDKTTAMIQMEYVPGKSLAASLKERQPTSALAVQIICQILEGVAHLHDSDIVHGDLSCQNVMVWQGGLKIIDFYARRPILGSPMYMAPEVIRLGRASREGDVWSAAIIMLMLEGVQPWRNFELPHLLYHLGSNPTAMDGPPELGDAGIFLDTARLIFAAAEARCSLTQALDMARRLGS